MYNLKVKSNNKITNIQFDKPDNLSEILIENDLYIDRPCGGKGTCGKCKVKFLSNAPAANSYDIKLLTDSELEEGYRLSCKLTISYDADIELTPKAGMTILENGLKQDNEIYFNDKTLSEHYGLAIDLGTTTIVAYLVSLADGKIIDAESTINPQRTYGDNVITRSEYIHSNDDGLNTLKDAAMDKINELAVALCEKNKVDSQNIMRMVLSGNTIMQHIILGVDPYQITLAPYTPVFTEQKNVTAKEFGININPDANCYITNSISGYVGGDIVSGIIAAGMDKSQDTSILIDIGTNGEMVLSHKGKMYSCSVAAGPAFEGEHIKFGLGGILGAINKAWNANNTLSYKTIGDAEPIGICGSGLLDIVAFLKEEGILDEMGSMDESRCQKEDDETVYYITDDIYISQKDIREVQLAKSAVAAGVEVLLAKAGIGFDDVDNLYLAGGFGSYLNVKSAATIGLINKALEDKCQSIGNTAGMGSVKSLLSDKVLASLDDLVDNVEYIELSLDITFNNLFVDNMMF